MSTGCVTTTHYAVHVSAECAPGGTGNCDGLCAAHDSVECTCECHREWCTTLPDTVEGVRKWHDERNNVVASFDDRLHGDASRAAAAAVVAAKAMDAASSTRTFTARAGQDRTVVTFTYR
jgi:hypothetical protein